MRRAPALAVLLAAAACALAAAPAGAPRGGGATLAIARGGGWTGWWSVAAAPARWEGPDPRVAGALKWRRLAGGIDWAEARLAGSAPAWRMRLVVARLDPARVRLSLDLATEGPEARPAWTLDRAPGDALLAVNAGQFVQTLPWGWVVAGGRERLRPGRGPLSAAFAVDGDGRVRWIPGDSLAGEAPDVETAFQSYPVLLARDGSVPAALREPGRGVDLGHRDARLALGQTRDGRLLVVLTRWDALGPAAGGVPLGPTTPEMAAVMGALGARDAVMLDGGISAQLLLRERPGGRAHRWPGLRKVPLALLVRAR